MTTYEDRITIVEGPPPTFEPVGDAWALGLSESPNMSKLAITRLRTFNGNALVERCQRAWRQKLPIFLEYRQSDGLRNQAPIVAARNVETQEGHVLLLWVRMVEEVELEVGYEDDSPEE